MNSWKWSIICCRLLGPTWLSPSIQIKKRKLQKTSYHSNSCLDFWATSATVSEASLGSLSESEEKRHGMVPLCRTKLFISYFLHPNGAMDLVCNEKAFVLLNPGQVHLRVPRVPANAAPLIQPFVRAYQCMACFWYLRWTRPDYVWESKGNFALFLEMKSAGAWSLLQLHQEKQNI